MTNHIGLAPLVSRLALASLAVLAMLLFQPGAASAQSCGGGPLSTSKGNIIGSLGGAAAGGLLGSQFGSGAGKGVMTGLGVVGGALAGGYVGRKVEGCDQGSQAASHRTVTPKSASSRGTPVAADTRTCRQVLSQATIDGREQQVEGIACLDPDGVWRTASGPAAERSATEDLVLRTQQRLHDQGFYVRNNVDGKWGPATSTAVRSYQRANGLAPNGQIDVPTRTALGLDPAPLGAPTAQTGAAQTGAAQTGQAVQPTQAVAPAAQFGASGSGSSSQQ
jgi:surface antigen